ncbi:probable G-protein coupled receptor 83 [Lingula anatina]|uniref:Probable G-protein coupled receptor 83 n=1 Tax=Lingula anatina TaxID=7574 RepID=A0A1S3HK61_LINAN|nr:probable G-protein coupled receptor 83 [Lingula anatina]|eukprot:XP_013385384.1 probable G-protein coupled receptor 83 [Lingula anatina]
MADSSCNMTSNIYQFLYRAEGIALFVMLSVISVTGAVGNALVFAVYWKKQDQQTSTFFIITLAVTDFITCIINVPFTLVMEFINLQIESDILCKLYLFLVTSTVPFSTFIMAAIAVDRYLCICHPLLHLMNLTRAKVTVGALACLAGFAGLMVGLCHGVYQLCPTYSINTTMEYTTDPTWSNYSMMAPFAQAVKLWEPSPDQEIRYTGFCRPNTFILGAEVRLSYKYFHISLYLVSLITIIVLYSLLFKSVIDRRRKKREQRAQVPTLLNGNKEATELHVVYNKKGSFTKTVGSRNNSHGNVDLPPEIEHRRLMEKARDRKANVKTALMLFVVAVVFIIGFLPAILMSSKILIPTNHDAAKIYFYFYFWNHVANPIIYSFMNENFRDEMRKLVRCC